MKIYLLIIIFFLMAAFFIISENNLKLADKGNFSKFSVLYASWLSHIFDNSKNLVGYIVKMDWLPENKTSSG